MLLTGLCEANKRFEEMQSEHRFVENVELGEDVYDVYMAKKKTGKPKDGEPSKSSELCNDEPGDACRSALRVS